MDKYKTNFLDYSSKLDAMTDSYGEITKLAAFIAEEQNEDAVLKLVKKLSSIIDDESYMSNVKKIAGLLNECLINYLGHLKLTEICEKDKPADNDTRTLHELTEELGRLVGLKNVKEKVVDLMIYQEVQKMRRDNNLHTAKNTLHLAFMGNPGTGKTTVARIVGRIYKEINLLSKGHFIEVSRTDLIAGYQGQTALKVKKVIERAKGGVLFIDEAYSITENDHSDSYGRECLTELTKALEDYRGDLVVIVAGYTEPMNKFFDSNPGLKSRFNTFIEFDDYSAAELEEILESICKQNDYRLSEEARKKTEDYFKTKVANKDINFSNGRMARNVYDDLIMNHARRIIKLDEITLEDLSVITEKDAAFLI